MLGQDTRGPSGTPSVDRRPAALAEACREVREHLDAIARALAALREDIDRSLAAEPSVPEQPEHTD